jgi:hypothetical protein
MTGKAPIVLVVIGFAAIIATTIVRAIVHRRRELRDGIGGTQDIAMWGTFIGLACFVGAIICGILWRLQR